MNKLEDKNKELYEIIKHEHFDEYENEEDPFIASWNNDPDEVWDAEAHLIDLYESSVFMKKFINEYND